MDKEITIQITDEELHSIEETCKFGMSMNGIMQMVSMSQPKAFPFKLGDFMEATVVMAKAYEFVQKVKKQQNK